MATVKVIQLVSGKKKEVASIDSFTGNDGEIISTNSSGHLDATLLPPGSGIDLKSFPSFENLVAGDFVNIFNDGGTLKARKADATDNTKPADGFVLDAVTAPAVVNVYFEGINSGLSGLTLGSEYFLSETAGAATATPVSGTGKVNQFLGKAISATEISTEISDYIELA